MRDVRDVNGLEHDDGLDARSLRRASMSTDLYRRSSSTRALRWAAGVTAAIAVGIMVVLASSGDSGGRDATGDVRLIRGRQPRAASSLPIAASIADITEASVSSKDSEIVFEMTTAAPIPNELERSSLEFRFDLSEDGRDTWIVSATVNVAVTAAVVSHTTEYTSTTIDESMPGSVEVFEKELTITLDPALIDGFPGSFDWKLSSTLVAFRDIAGSTRVEDRVPDEGTLGGP